VFDFYFGEPADIARDEIKFLVSVKRMLPKWCNSIPDAEFIALCKLLEDAAARAQRDGRTLVLAETGAGASTIAFAYYALKSGGKAFSWDFNGEKGSLIRTVCTETLCNVVRRNINDHWHLVAYSSLSPHLGLPILGDLVDHVDVFYHDSQHVLETVLAEMVAVQPHLVDGAVVAMDDASYDFVHTDTAYINVFRRKLGLHPMSPLEGNKSQPFYVEVEERLREYWEDVRSVAAHYQSICHSDVFLPYFASELEVRSAVGMERLAALEHRFAAWTVTQRKA
jgi:hypothetical protein